MTTAKTMGTQARNRKHFVSAQEQALRVNAIKHSIYKTSDTHTHTYTHTHTHTHTHTQITISPEKWLCYFLWPKHSHQGTGKNWQVPGLNNRITESLECQGSVHTGSYRCSRREQEMSKRIHQYIKQIDIPADIISIQKTAILGTAYILQRVVGI